MRFGAWNVRLIESVMKRLNYIKLNLLRLQEVNWNMDVIEPADDYKIGQA